MAAKGLHAIADAVAAIPATVMDRAVDAVAAVADDEARRATGDGRMSGGAGRGAKLRTVARVAGGGRNVRAEVVGVPAGGWAILEAGARSHVVAPVRRGGVLVGGSLRHPVRGPVNHPGARGKRSWSNVTRQAARDVPELFADAVGKVLS